MRSRQYTIRDALIDLDWCPECLGRLAPGLVCQKCKYDAAEERCYDQDWEEERDDCPGK